ncbi:hypothetical protein ACQKLN_31075 [Paenibacillus glucanolyticus]|uniref:hypothetical protein n=1 Tax=Paenibacillus glucanolyticus TaxID=59843 RepID=UPI003674EBAB
MKLELGKPIIHCYPIHLHHFSIINKNKKYEPWLYSNYIQISTPPELPYDRHKIINFFRYDEQEPFYGGTSPFMKECKLERIETIDEIVPSFRESINQDKYMNIFVDDYYLPFRRAYRKNHYPHDLFLFGYTDEKRVFHVLGFDQYGLPKEYEVDYQVLSKAYLSVNSLLKSEYSESNWMACDYQMHYTDAECELEIPRMVQLYQSFIDSIPFDQMPWAINGAAVYPLLMEYYYQYYNSLTAYDHRPFHMLYEHKMLMLKRVDYIQKELDLDLTPIRPRFSKLCQDFLDLRNFFMKNNIRAVKLSPNQFNQKMDALIDKELDLYTSIVKILK